MTAPAHREVQPTACSSRSATLKPWPTRPSRCCATSPASTPWPPPPAKPPATASAPAASSRSTRNITSACSPAARSTNPLLLARHFFHLVILARSARISVFSPQLKDLEVDLHIQFHRHRFAVQHRRLELVSLHRRDGVLIQPHAHAAGHMHVLRPTILID